MCTVACKLTPCTQSYWLLSMAFFIYIMLIYVFIYICYGVLDDDGAH